MLEILFLFLFLLLLHVIVFVVVAPPVHRKSRIHIDDKKISFFVGCSEPWRVGQMESNCAGKGGAHGKI